MSDRPNIEEWAKTLIGLIINELKVEERKAIKE